ncbi:MAG: hypothetical protein ACXVEE_34990, partial [Polyangiales bacterium]
MDDRLDGGTKGHRPPAIGNVEETVELVEPFGAVRAHSVEGKASTLAVRVKRGKELDQKLRSHTLDQRAWKELTHRPLLEGNDAL